MLYPSGFNDTFLADFISNKLNEHHLGALEEIRLSDKYQ